MPLRKSVARLGLVLGVVAVSTSALYLAFAASLPVPPRMGPGLLRVASVVVDPATPAPGESVVVTAHIEGVYTAIVNLWHAADFGTNLATVVPMAAAGEGDFTATVGPFPDGSDVWLLVAASAAGSGPAMSEATGFQVGTVPRGGPSSLRIASVVQTPEDVDYYEPVTVTATVPSNATVQEVRFTGITFFQGGEWDTMITMAMRTFNDQYRVDLSPFYCSRDCVVAYRITARDDTGNTAVSAVRTFAVRVQHAIP